METEDRLPEAHPLTADEAASREEAVRSELARILGSTTFRGSRRSQDFLRFVVEHALAGETEVLKERWIGSEVFDRPSDYDTGQDSIVRVKANEVRKRLAQYYREPGTGSRVQIALPPGSYVPEFVMPLVVEEPAERPRPQRNWWTPALATAGALALVLGAVAIWRGRPVDTIELFWRPVLRSSRPVVLCVAHPVVYHLNGDARLREREGGGQDQWVPMARITRDPDHYVGVGDAFALARLASYFGRAGKASQVRIGTDTSFTDLREAPAVLIGAYTNQWTIEVTKDCRFVFDREGASVFVRDRGDDKRRWVRTETAPPSDYAIISRLVDSRTGGAVVVAAGLAHPGTYMAGDFLTNPPALADALGGAPAGWETKNLQIVLRGEVIGQTPGPPKVLATHFW